MSESLIHQSVAAQIKELAELAEAACEDFQHQVIDSSVTFTGPGEQSIFNITIPPNTALVVTSLEIKALYDVNDATFNNSDFRATDDLNPYGPFFGSGSAVGQIRWLINGTEQIFATAYDFGVINQGILFTFLGNRSLVIKANPNQPTGKDLTLVSRLNTFIVVPEASVTELQKKSTRIVTATNVP